MSASPVLPKPRLAVLVRQCDQVNMVRLNRVQQLERKAGHHQSPDRLTLHRESQWPDPESADCG